MNIAITLTIYLLIIIREYYISLRKMQTGEKVLFFILSVTAVISAFPASRGMDFDTVGSSLSGMISLFLH